MKKTKRAIVGMWMCLLLLTFIPLRVYAAEPVDTDRTTALTIHYQQEEQVLRGARFAIYRVADVTEDAEFIATGDFARFTGKLNGLKDAAEWDALAQKLLAYADDAKPLRSGKTDTDGTCAFSGLRTGLYLVVGDEIRVGKVSYTCKPFMVCLPQYNKNADTWTYAVDAAPKAGEPQEKPHVPDEPHDPHLPQTGALRWPIPVMAGLGLALLSVGAVQRRKSEE